MLERAITRAGFGLLLVLAASASGRAEPTERSTSPPGFRLQLPTRLELVAGALGKLQVRLQPAPGYRISKKAPLRIDLRPAAGSGLTVKKARLDLGDAIDPESSAPAFHAHVQGAEPGEHQLTVSLRFWLCRGKLCRPIRSEASLQVEVRAAPLPEAPDGGPPSESAERTAPN